MGKPHARKRVSVGLLARLAISFLLIGWLLNKVELGELADSLYASRWWLFGLATLILCAGNLIASLRWRVILATQGTHVSVSRLFYWYMVGGFFNMFLPTALGGDVMRIYEAGRGTGRMTRAAVSVMMERMIGFSGLIALAVPALCLVPPGLRQPKIYWGVLGIAVCFASALIAILHPASCRWAVWALRRFSLSPLAEKIDQGHAALRKLTEHRDALTYAFCLTLAFHLVGVFCVYLIGLSLGADVPFIYYCIAIPIIWLITMVPISINGIGVREGGFVLFFTAAGMSDASALLLSFLSFAQLIIMGLLGGVLYSVYPFFFEADKSVNRVSG